MYIAVRKKSSLRLCFTLSVAILATLTLQAQQHRNSFNFQWKTGVPRAEKYRILTGFDHSQTGTALTAHYSGIAISALSVTPAKKAWSKNNAEPWHSLRYELGVVDLRADILDYPLTFVTGIGFQWNLLYSYGPYKPDYNTNGITWENSNQYHRTRLYASYLTIPLLAETNYWRSGQLSPIFFNIGIQLKTLLRGSIYDYPKGEKPQKVAGRSPFAPFGADLLAQTGWGHWGVSVAIPLSPLLKRQQKQQLYTWSVGLRYYWSQR